MQQHRVICKEIHKQLQRMCFNKPVMRCPESVFGSRAPGSRALGLSNHGKVSPKNPFKTWQEYKHQHGSRKLQYINKEFKRKR